MKYMGSKARISTEILSVTLKNRTKGQYYVEPFCGGCNIIDKVAGNRIANDLNKYLIAMWKGLQENKDRPRTISKELYSKARTEYNNGTNIEFDDFMIGWIGWMASYNGRFFDGGYSGHNVNGRDYISEQIRNTEKQVPQIKEIEFYSTDYQCLQVPDNSIIYCDPPYKGTKQYATSKKFNHNSFWDWCRVMTKQEHNVFISEYNAPNDFVPIWKANINSYMNAGRAEKVVEKLFVYNPKGTKLTTKFTQSKLF